jgi:hypothetical protein
MKMKIPQLWDFARVVYLLILAAWPVSVLISYTVGHSQNAAVVEKCIKTIDLILWDIYLI